ncbi:hypothetical protein T4E_11408 [Trichinella pseudospiralis]|uniref:Uncharacterized protein n=1 Tax=Trichinella pseudospiralis TaxID=6337 RepID=A0A0V0Y5Q8_TRIPS|nr:hypothetical protein T4E_11408 [Trichinella pseudospiralis]
MTTIPTMYNPQQVCGASTIPSVVLNIQILLCVIDSCSTFVQDMEKCLRVIWTIFQITEVMHQKDHEKSCSADKSVFNEETSAKTSRMNKFLKRINHIWSSVYRNRQKRFTRT